MTPSQIPSKSILCSASSACDLHLSFGEWSSPPATLHLISAESAIGARPDTILSRPSSSLRRAERAALRESRANHRFSLILYDSMVNAQKLDGNCSVFSLEVRPRRPLCQHGPRGLQIGQPRCERLAGLKLEGHVRDQGEVQRGLRHARKKHNYLQSFPPKTFIVYFNALDVS